MSDAYRLAFTMPAMAAVFTGARHVRRLLDFEAALARAEERAGVIPAGAAAAIGAQCAGEHFDVEDLYRQAVSAGTLIIPLIAELKKRLPAEWRGFVHLGATSQDAIDTAHALQMRDGLAVLTQILQKIWENCAGLADQHRRTVMAGRTLMQQALPITFGLKAARWLGLLTRQWQALKECADKSLTLQFGGAAGTLAALGMAGIQVAEYLGEDLRLSVPELPWHAERDRSAALACALGVAAGSLAKIANDLILLAQTEVGEISEGSAPGKGGSSAMPQKRNPVDAMETLAAARLAVGVVPVIISAMANEHERAAGAWQLEWAAFPDLFGYTAGAAEHVEKALAGLTIDAARMRGNLDLGGGAVMAESLTMALCRKLERSAAQDAVQEACRRVEEDGTTLRQAALDNERIRAALSDAEIECALDPLQYLGCNDIFIDRALAAYRDLRAREEPR